MVRKRQIAKDTKAWKPKSKHRLRPVLRPEPSINDGKFRLSASFVAPYKKEDPHWGFAGMGELVYRRTYSRPVLLPSGRYRSENWWDTVERVVNGAFNLLRRHNRSRGVRWDETVERERAEDMFKRIFLMKFLPPGRGLWAMGSQLTEERQIYAALNNCGFVSTKDLHKDPVGPFTFLMDASMLGVGVGFDTRGAGKVLVRGADAQIPRHVFVVPDTREGWVEALEKTLRSHFEGRARVDFDFSNVRGAGEPIRGFGGVSSGPGVLKTLLEEVDVVLQRRRGQCLTSTDIVDLMNYIGKCVVSGNVRRTAEIAFGSPDDSNYLNLKNYAANPHRAAFGWASNNSIFATLGMDYSTVVQRVKDNGEPGFAWLENMQKFGRMNGVANNADWRALGGNPCLEQTLEHYELCCLVETFPLRNSDLDDFLSTLRSAFLYAKIVTLGDVHWPQSREIMRRNRRIGASLSGVTQFLGRCGINRLREYCERGYAAIAQVDRELSREFGVPESIKKTSIKPSGTVSLLAGATPGMHFPHSRRYIRRVRLARNSPLLNLLRAEGKTIEPDVVQPDTDVVEFLVDVGSDVPSVTEVGMHGQLALAAFLQKHWADNQVSCTVSFDPDTEGDDLEDALRVYQYRLKGISFLPDRRGPGPKPYAQMPYEEIPDCVFDLKAQAADRRRRFYEQLEAMEDKKMQKLGKEKLPGIYIDVAVSEKDRVMDLFCDSDVCLM